ncbi:MAG: hypothetical protein KatS3mg067_0930 [Thermosynechococcus sp.]|uniref:Eco57I restriction-modification methylase domain-containing protein n=1 Tax=Thermosynechococcus sp. TaxID=2814275 RepID=UPI0022068A87|nr:N-6 DNA methylase [Thermosynechococcus sp.]BCX11992.1 MAG: hypothetical protein KatS3mg067_0930 [Thermosynechococcus sp.]
MNTLLQRIQSCLNAAGSPQQLSNLFCRTLHWGAPRGLTPRTLDLGTPINQRITLHPVAQLSGLPVYRVEWPDDQLPGVTARRAVQRVLKPIHAEHLLCYVTSDQRQVAFTWARQRSDGKIELRTLPYEVGSAARTTIERLGELAFSLDELMSGEPPITTLTDKLDRAFDVEAVTQRFYQELANWFFWAREHVQFPMPPTEKNSEAYISQSLIRLITRLIFCWFVKEMGLIPRELFDLGTLSRLLKNGDKLPESKNTTFYKAILQNLFFATLNQEIGKRQFRKRNKDPRGRDPHCGITNLYRYEDYFNNPDQFLQLAKNIPFLNGGLFECLDRVYRTEENRPTIRIDGFSDHPKNPLFMPDFLFFSDEQVVDLSQAYGQTKFKRATVRGLIHIFHRYNFTVTESTPLDQEVALDPELAGKVFENLLAAYNPETATTARKATGSYYTPRSIVEYMVDESLLAYLKPKLQAVHPSDTHESRLCHLLAYNDEPHQFSPEEVETLITALDNLKAIDPACGSGAFLMGLLHKLVFILGKLDPRNEGWKEKQIAKAQEIPDATIRDKVLADIEQAFAAGELDYGRKLYLIENCLYGVDIQPIAVQIAKMRFFISLTVDQKVDPSAPNLGIRPLPNLETKFVAANTLIGIERPAQFAFRTPKIEELERELARVREAHFTARTPQTKQKYRECDAQLRAELAELLKHDGLGSQTAEKLAAWDPYDQNAFANWFDPEWMFGIRNDFDIVIGNPPYISTKGIDAENKKQLEKHFGFTDDTYNHFFFKGLELLKDEGILTYITSKSYWTIQTKKNLRELLLKNTILQIFDTANPFENAMVDTGVVIVKKATPTPTHEVVFLDGKTSITQPQKYTIQQNDYATAPNKVIFVPTDFNKKIYQRLGKTVNELLNQWWDKISTSKNIDKHKKELETYRNSLKPGDITLLGLITEGGQGLATANNGKYIGVLEGTKWADNVRKQRPEKLLLATKFCKEKGIRTKNDAQQFLNNLNEKEIRQLFDDLKEKYGRDIFGQGWLYRIVSPDEIADVDTLTNDEKLNGIDGEKTFVPYDKGDKDGNRWYAPTPYYIDWSKENVKFLKENSGKKGEGMPVVRNPQFYFREGFCWTDVSYAIRCRIKENSLHDVLSMSLFPIFSLINSKFIVSLLNSDFMSTYLNAFVNTTVHFQINDARQLPIIIPTAEQLKVFEDIFNRAVSVQKQKFAGKLSEKEAEAKLEEIQRELDERVLEMYGVT